MKTYPLPTLSEFQETCRTQLSYLVSKYGFVEDIPEEETGDNPFKVRFLRDDLLIVVEGMNYGQTATLTIFDHNGRKIWPSLLIDPDHEPRSKDSLRRGGQLEQITQEAQCLLEYGQGLLVGDLSVMNVALARLEERWADHQARRKFGIAVQEGVKAYDQENWPRVIALLAPHETELSPRMAKKLEIARQKLKSVSKLSNGQVP